MAAGRLDRRLTFEAPKEISNGAGNFVDGFEPQFTVAASVLPLRGGEDVMASRLQGVQPAIVTIRNSTQARRITSAWRSVDPRAGMNEHGKPNLVFQVKEPPRVSDDRSMLEMLVTSGVAA